MLCNEKNILQLRVALTTREHKAMISFVKDNFRVNPSEVWESPNGGCGTLFDMGKASLEIFDDLYSAYIDEMEVGERVSGDVRLALEVTDIHDILRRILENGNKLVHGPLETPWGDINARIEAPNGLQVTLFQAKK